METTTAFIREDGQTIPVAVIAVSRYHVSTVQTPDGTVKHLNPGHVFATADEAERVAAERAAALAMCEAQRGGSFGSGRAYQGD